jgi:hypothetical protein
LVGDEKLVCENLMSEKEMEGLAIKQFTLYQNQLFENFENQ